MPALTIPLGSSPPLVISLHPLILLLGSFLIPPRPWRRHYSWPAFSGPLGFALLPFPPHILATFPRPWRVSRPVEHLMLAYFALAVLLAAGRLVGRIAQTVREQSSGQSTPGEKDEKAGKEERDDGKKTKEGTTRPVVSQPIVYAVALHLIAWRLMCAPPIPLPEDWVWPWDVATVVGVSLGLTAATDEVMRLFTLLGLSSQRPPRVLPRILHAILAIHRLLLAVGILSSGLDTTVVSPSDIGSISGSDSIDT